MKKVLTITFHRANNYGAMLQTYAMQKVLEKKYETQIIDYYAGDVFDDYKLIKPFNKSSKKFIASIIKYPFYRRRYKNFQNFRKKLRFTKYYSDVDTLQKDFPVADAYIVGSDQIWNPKITGGLDDAYFLNFGTSKTKRISYAASSGKGEIPLHLENEFKEKLKRFSAISVREKKLKDYIERISNYKAFLVLDPVLLLTKNDWEKESVNHKIINQKFILVYSVDNSNELFYEVINELARRTGYPIVFFDRVDKSKKMHYPKKSCYNCGPSEFISLLQAAEYVVTTSFHALAMSIIFNKNFFAILSTYPERLVTLVETLELQNRIVKNIESIQELIDTDIDWKKTNKILKRMRENSLEWLYKSIEGKEIGEF